MMPKYPRELKDRCSKLGSLTALICASSKTIKSYFPDKKTLFKPSIKVPTFKQSIYSINTYHNETRDILNVKKDVEGMEKEKLPSLRLRRPKLFLSVIWLPQGLFWATVEEVA